MDLANLLNDNNIIDCGIDLGGHLIVENIMPITSGNETEYKNCVENANHQVLQERPDTSSGDTRADFRIQGISHNDLISCQERSSPNHEINLLEHDSNKSCALSNVTQSIVEEPHPLQHSTPEKNPEILGESNTD
ncbi:hypothetical protein Zmor_026583 [Zophobas morio]|uniref:Uncharacterized protein n=1 Tax=Zophobas morio TaxID=2755281 RepID=A0AA38HVX0_9CUCU|nr:hypothetical protein Zmor_026583 [Zophobas morio]